MALLRETRNNTYDFAHHCSFLTILDAYIMSSITWDLEQFCDDQNAFKLVQENHGKNILNHCKKLTTYITVRNGPLRRFSRLRKMSH